MNNDQTIYRIPPKLSARYLLGGFTPAALVLIAGTGIVTIIMALNGAPFFLLIPAVLLVSNWRPTAEKSIWEMIMLRINYFNNDNIYSLEECKKIWK